MKSQPNFRSVVFKRAYQTVKKSGCSFQEALIQSWEKYRDFKAGSFAELVSRKRNYDFIFYGDNGQAIKKTLIAPEAHVNTNYLQMAGSSY